MALKKRTNRPVRMVANKRDEDPMTESGLSHKRKASSEYANRILDGLQGSDKHLPSGSHYEITRTLGEGGMGTVFLADHVSAGGIRKEVAIKVLKDTTDADAIRKFVEEAQLLAQLTQGTVVELLALESMDVNLPARKDPRTGRLAPPSTRKLYFMVQEYVKGVGLDNVLGDLQENILLMCPPMVGFILNKAVIALAEAHDLTDDDGNSLGLVHRDISPSNILFNAKAGITKLADFGVAKAFSGDDSSDEGRIIGKPRYMSPEQLDGYATTASDIWALGIVGYEALTGFPPYRSEGATLQDKVVILKKQFRARLLSPKEILRYPPNERFSLNALSDIIMKCLRQNPEERPTAQELNALLEGSYLYTKGLGPTNKALAAYLRLLDCAIGGGEIIPPAGYEDSEDSKVLQATLWIDNPVECFTRRSSAVFNPEFVMSVKNKVFNPCLAQ